MLPTTDIDVTLTTEELAATVEALHDTLLRRLRWTIVPGHDHWKGVRWEAAQGVLDQLTQAYTKAMMTFQTLQDAHPDFAVVFSFPVEIWNYLAEISLAKSWDEAPVHEPDKCAACKKMGKL